jgi:hypothetical protein
MLLWRNELAFPDPPCIRWRPEIPGSRWALVFGFWQYLDSKMIFKDWRLTTRWEESCRI